MQVVSASAAAALIQDGWTVATGGFGCAGLAEAVSGAIEQRFLATGFPRALTLVHAAGQGDRISQGTGHYAYAGMLKRVVGGHFGGSDQMAALAMSGEIEAYNLPQGVISQLYRAIAGGKPGVITPIGLHTFVDPRQDGGALNARTTEALVDVLTVRGQEYLHYAAFPIHCGIIRGTTADARGNISCEHEAMTLDILAIAQAARNSGGIVIAQVKRLAEHGALRLSDVRVPGMLVDYVVVADPDQHWQTCMHQYNPAFSGEEREPAAVTCTPLPLDARKIVARRALLEVLTLASPIVNLGTGMPSCLGPVAREEGVHDLTFTVEAGGIGGIPAHDAAFGAMTNPDAIIDQPAQFDFYDGGGIDVAVLGLGEVDGSGSVNVSRFGHRLTGVGGFINITQATSHIIFCGTFRAGKLEIAAGEGELRIVQDGATPKFVERLQHLSFNGAYASSSGANVLYVTERAVFALRDGRLHLTEIAPGIDLQAQVLDLSNAEIEVSGGLKKMDERIFHGRSMTQLAVTGENHLY